jgi:S-adenosylmethionine:tRNA-ribosyltransferase-isomerase (queuine synthetase)
MAVKRDETEGFLRLCSALFLAITAVGLIAALIGCNSEKRATRKLLKADLLNHTAVAQYCGSKFPPKDSIYEHETFLQGDTIVFNDTSVIHDTVTGNTERIVTRTVFRTDTLLKDKFVQVANTAMIEAQQATITNLQAQLVRSNQRSSFLLWLVIIETAFIAVRFILKYFKIL